MDKELKHIIRLLYGIIILAVVIIVLLGLPQTNKPNIPKEEQIPLASIGFDKEDTLNQYDVAALNLAFFTPHAPLFLACLLYTSDAADDLLCVALGGRRIIKKKINTDRYSS